MKTIVREYKVYSFNELSDEGKQSALQYLSDINTDYDWFEDTIEDFQGMLESKGFLDADIQFSGFCSQGDGACFDAQIDITELFKKFLKQQGYKVKTSLTDTFFNHFSYSIQKNVYWPHYSRYIDFEGPSANFKCYKRLYKLACDFQTWLEDYRLALCCKIYGTLSKHYDYLISDKAIIETIEANDYTFLENGKLFN